MSQNPIMIGSEIMIGNHIQIQPNSAQTPCSGIFITLSNYIRPGLEVLWSFCTFLKIKEPFKFVQKMHWRAAF